MNGHGSVLETQNRWVGVLPRGSVQYTWPVHIPVLGSTSVLLNFSGLRLPPQRNEHHTWVQDPAYNFREFLDPRVQALHD